MILTAHQPPYLPWLGFFAKVDKADVFCWFDDVQYEKKGWGNRNYIKTHNGALMLSVPVESKGHFEKKICQIEIVADGWVRKHLRSIELAYSKATYFKRYYAALADILSRYEDGGLLSEMNIDLCEFLFYELGMSVKTEKASDYMFKGIKSDLVLNMCQQLGASKYIFGGEGENYADVLSFRKAGVAVDFQNYKHPAYTQLHEPFLPNMSIIDLLFNEGQNSLRILRGEV